MSAAEGIPVSAAADLEGGRLSFGEKVGYALGDAASNFYWKTFEFFIIFFYTDVFGISAGAVGTMMLVTKLVDAVTDPMMGAIADRTRTRWGRFRPYILYGALPLALGSGDNAELRQPLGISIVNGLILSQLLTLYTTPVVYLYLDRFRLWTLSLKKPAALATSTPP